VSARGSADEIEERVRADDLLAPGRPVVVLLSGGCDSSALLHLAVRIAGTGSVSALHVNYGLREAAGRDERSCAELCVRLRVPLEVRRPRREEGQGNVQAWAREVRYTAAEAIARQREAEVATGHTATDQVETVLYRLASSPSRRALLGMSQREGIVIRPLLGLTRTETVAYCETHGLRYVVDESNFSDAYARNRIRARLLPALQDVHPAALQNVLAVAEVLRDEAAVLDEMVAAALRGRHEITLAELRELAPALRRLVVQRLADEAAGGFAPGAARRAEEVAALRDQGTAALDLPYGVRALAEGGTLRFVRTPHAPPPRDSRPLIN
jgi:tRNA(Ile)-lysidine synthase